jgi:Zn-dependent protease
MRGPYSEYTAPPIYIYPDRPKPGIHFSRTELVQLAVAILALSGALTVLYVTSYTRAGFLVMSSVSFVAILFGTSLLSVATGVGLHEIMHKAVAQRYGHWAEFRYYPMGLVLAYVFAFLGFIYGAPGATYISGNVTQEQNGRISAAGPATNIVLGIGFLGAEAALLAVASSTAVEILVLVVQQVAFINVVLAGFNMIPVMPLDGAKVWRWNKAAFLGIVTVVIAIFGAAVYAGLLYL